MPTAAPSAPAERTWGEAAKDAGAAVMGGLAGLGKTAGDVYGLVTGDMDNGLSRVAGDAQEFWDDKKSDAFKAKAQQRKANIDAEPGTLGKFGVALRDTLTDPALAADTVFSNLPTMLPGMAAGRLAAVIRRRLARTSASPNLLPLTRRRAETGVGKAFPATQEHR